MKKVYDVNYSTLGVSCGFLTDEQIISAALEVDVECVLFVGVSSRNDNVYAFNDVLYIFEHEFHCFDHLTLIGSARFRRFSGGVHHV